MEGLGFQGKKESLDLLEIQGQWGKMGSEEDREILASQAMVRRDKKELRAQEDSLEMWGRRVILVIPEFLGDPDQKDLED